MKEYTQILLNQEKIEVRLVNDICSLLAVGFMSMLY